MFGLQDVQERRVFPRARFSEAVHFEDPHDAIYGGSLSQDVSEGGIRIRINDFLPLGSELMLQIAISAGRVVECVGRVVWIEKIPYGENYQAGVAFDDSAQAGMVRQVFRGIATRRTQNMS